MHTSEFARTAVISTFAADSKCLRCRSEDMKPEIVISREWIFKLNLFENYFWKNFYFVFWYIGKR